jgi:hypothetical protein
MHITAKKESCQYDPITFSGLNGIVVNIHSLNNLGRLKKIHRLLYT